MKTRSDVYAKFRTLCLVASVKSLEEVCEAKRSGFRGAWHLEYERGSGYFIEVIGIDKMEHPMGEQRRGAGEMIRTMDFAIGVLQVFKVDSMIQNEQRRRET